MVVQEREINELILQIFEEQEESFYFPIFSQKDAKAFVKALNNKGLAYEILSDNIGESEHSFNTWRKSLSRPGVGQRVIDRINQPFIDLLEEDTEELMAGQRLANAKSPLIQQNGHNGIHRSPSPARVAKQENDNELAARLNRARNRLQMQESVKKLNDSNAKEEDDDQEEGEFMTPSSHLSTPYATPNSTNNSASSTPASGNPPQSVNARLREEKTNNENEAICRLAEIRKALKHRADNIDLTPKTQDKDEKTEAQLAAERFKEKKRSPGLLRRREKELETKDTKERDSSSDDNSESSNKVSGLLQKFENKIESMRSRSTSNSSSKSSSEEDISRTSPRSPELKARSPEVKERSVEVKTEVKEKSPHLTEEKISVVQEKSLKKSTEIREKSPETKKQSSAPEATINSEENSPEKSRERTPSQKRKSRSDSSSSESSESSQSTSESEYDDADCPPEEAEEGLKQSSKSETQPEKTEITAEKMEVKVEKTIITEEKTEIQEAPIHESMEKKAERLAEQAKEEVSSLRRQVSERQAAAIKNRDSRDIQQENDLDIDENYNSDLDPDNEDQSPVMAKLVQKISTMRSTSKNGPGFLYVFSDSYESEVRVKVGTSKFPEKRLRQAQVFNPDLWQVLTQPVNQRISALNELTANLAKHAEPDTKLWFRCDLDTVIEAAEQVAAKFASKSIANHEESLC